VLARFDPAVVIWQTPELPWGGSFEGHDGALTFFGKLLENIVSTVTHDVIYAAGDHVVQCGRTAGTTVRNETPFDVPETHIWELRDAKAVRFTVYIDTPAMLEALNR
jgi:uncharacterized protein